jgi:pyridoxamine 5'-phosphate oxidase
VSTFDRLIVSTPVQPAFYDDLSGSLTHAWAQLARGVADRRSPFRTPTFGTAGLDGSPRLRTVVLRACDVEGRLLRFHTDQRSNKDRELQRNPAASLHIYDAGQKIQLRIAGIARVRVNDDLTKAAWDRSLVMSRAGYTQVPAPGVELDDPSRLPPLTGAPDGDTTGYENFAVVVFSVQSIEWLYLGAMGHRRARFTWLDGALRATWIAP